MNITDSRPILDLETTAAAALHTARRPAKPRRALYSVLVIALSFFYRQSAEAQWWNPFAPADFEECFEAVTKNSAGKSDLAINLSVVACKHKFPGRRKIGGGYTYTNDASGRSFDIKGPVPTKQEMDYINKQLGPFATQ